MAPPRMPRQPSNMRIATLILLVLHVAKCGRTTEGDVRSTRILKRLKKHHRVQRENVFRCWISGPLGLSVSFLVECNSDDGCSNGPVNDKDLIEKRFSAPFTANFRDPTCFCVADFRTKVQFRAEHESACTQTECWNHYFRVLSTDLIVKGEPVITDKTLLETHFELKQQNFTEDSFQINQQHCWDYKCDPKDCADSNMPPLSERLQAVNTRQLYLTTIQSDDADLAGAGPFNNLKEYVSQIPFLEQSKLEFVSWDNELGEKRRLEALIRQANGSITQYDYMDILLLLTEVQKLAQAAVDQEPSLTTDSRVLHMIKIDGFESVFERFNGEYFEALDKRINGRETYWTKDRKTKDQADHENVLYFCGKDNATVSHWTLITAQHLERAKDGYCPSYAAGELGKDILDPIRNISDPLRSTVNFDRVFRGKWVNYTLASVVRIDVIEPSEAVDQ